MQSPGNASITKENKRKSTPKSSGARIGYEDEDGDGKPEKTKIVYMLGGEPVKRPRTAYILFADTVREGIAGELAAVGKTGYAPLIAIVV
jgi:hypothetical protein